MRDVGGVIGVKDGREKKYFSGKYHVIFGQLIYFWKKEEQAHFIFWTIFCFSFHVYVEYSFEFRNPF